LKCSELHTFDGSVTESHMEITDIAVYVACIAFVITQVHLALTARKLLKRNDQSWGKAQTTIFESSKVIHDDVVKQIAESGKNSPLGDVKTTIAELESRVNGLPAVIEDKFLKLQGGLRESFVSFGDTLAKNLELLIPKLPPRIPFAGDPKGAQAAGVDSKKVNQIVNALELGVGTQGNLIGAINEVAGLLEQFGSPDLADWLQENPDKLPMIYARLQRNPRLAQGIAKMEQRLAGGAPPGNGGMRGSRGGEV